MDWKYNFKEIITSAQKGDEQAFSLIIENTQKKFFRFCTYLCFDVHLAQDICQDVYIKAIESLKEFESEAKLYSWLFKVAKNHYIDYSRNKDNQEFIDLDNLSAEECQQDSIEMKIEIKEILQKIAPDFRMALILVDGEGHSYQEAAEIIGISEDALRSRLHKARKYFIAKSKK